MHGREVMQRDKMTYLVCGRLFEFKNSGIGSSIPEIRAKEFSFRMSVRIMLMISVQNSEMLKESIIYVNKITLLFIIYLV